MKIIAMIPARLGSQRLKKKNLQLLKGQPLILHAINKARDSNVFDEVWVNSESDQIGKVASDSDVRFHKRPEALANNSATSEDFVYEFLKNHACDYVVQLHSIAPLLNVTAIRSFVNSLNVSKPDVLLSTEEIQIECAYEDRPINFSLKEKTNSQDLKPIQRIMWSITAWKRDSFLSAYEKNLCCTYNGEVHYFPLNKLASLVIKTKEDLDMAEALFDLSQKEAE